MSDLRHFLRYQIPGLMFFIHLNAILYGLEILCKEQIIRLIIPEVLIAVLVGWIIYQIYDTLNPEAHCMKKSIDKVIDWVKMEKNKSNEIKAKHAIQIGLYYNIKQNNAKRDYNLNMEVLLNLLSSKFDHWGSRFINSFINSICFWIYLPLIIKDSFFVIMAIFSALISFSIAIKIEKLKKELISYEGMLIKFKKNEIKKVIKKVTK